MNDESVPWLDGTVIWAHPMNIEMHMVEEGERLGRSDVADCGALVMTIADDIQIVFESPLDVMSVLHEARHLIGDYILDHPDLFEDVED
jgi:hypothetical protein